MTETGGAFKDCTPGRVPWWAPSTITAFAIIWALGVKLSSFISVLLRRHKRHRETHTRSKGTRSELDLERGDRYSFQSSGTLDDSRERVTDGESTDNYTECELGKHVPPPEARKRGFSVKSGSIKLAPEIVHPSVRFQRLSSVRVGIQTAPWQPGQIGGYGRATINQVMRRDDITSLTNEERYGRLGRWLKKKHIGLSPRQQLMMKLYCERFTTVSYPAGIVMFTVYSVLCTFSWIFYIIETVDEAPFSAVGVCYSLKMRILAWLHFPINLFCLGYYVLRCCAATDPARFVLTYGSIIDLIAIPPTLFAPFMAKRHLDLNFLRATCLFNYVEVLTFLGIIKSNRSIQSARICFALFTMWMVGSGLMHGIEHLGDFWSATQHVGSWSYFEACYFLLVTLSTVGYGDYVTHTTLGKLFICIFIPVAMGVSASFIPELFRNFNNNPVFSDRYETMHGEKHALVCGNFDNHSLRAFIKGFLNGSHAKGRVHLNLVILRPMPIDLALKAILSHFHAWVRYFVGSPNNPRDLARTKMKDARAAIVLATPNSTDRDAEDGANIMQAIALKSQKKTLRVVLQLHNFRNKCLINNFPRWAYLANDVVVCMEELKFGLMAYNCMAPGFATLILNLLNIHGAKKISSRPLEPWREEYEYGFRMELHDVGISHEFDNISMRDLSTFTYEKWNIIILAVRCFEPPQMVINPTNMQYVIQGNKMRAIVIAKDYTEALRLQWYCTTCLAHESVERCQCTKPRSSRRQKVTIAKDLALYQQIDQSRRRDFTSEFLAIFEDARARAGPLTSFRHSIDVMFPLSLGSKSISGAGNGGIPPPYNTQHSNPETTTAHRKHASIDLVAPTAGYRSDTATIDRTGSFHWVSDIPLTKATLTPNRATEYDFRRHFLVCVVGTPSGRPLNLENFILPFRFHWQPVQDIVILGDSHLIGPNEWTKLKNLPRIFIVHGDPCSFTDLHAVQLCRSNACVILGDSGGDSSPCTTDQCLQDRKTLLCAMNIRSLLQREFQIVHLTTELRYEKNAHLFSSIDTQQNDYKLPVWFNEPFARGLIFSNSLLYSCLSSLFYNDDVFHFLRVLISGQAADEIEALFAVGNGLQPALENQKSRMTGVNVSLRGFNQPPFSFMASERRRKPLTFGEIFLRCLTCWEILCLGLYRLDSRGFRYVLTNPQPNTVLFSQDMFYCFMSASQRDTPGAWKFGETPRANVRVPTS